MRGRGTEVSGHADIEHTKFTIHLRANKNTSEGTEWNVHLLNHILKAHVLVTVIYARVLDVFVTLSGQARVTLHSIIMDLKNASRIIWRLES